MQHGKRPKTTLYTTVTGAPLRAFDACHWSVRGNWELPSGQQPLPPLVCVSQQYKVSEASSIDRFLLAMHLFIHNRDCTDYSFSHPMDFASMVWSCAPLIGAVTDRAYMAHGINFLDANEWTSFTKDLGSQVRNCVTHRIDLSIPLEGPYFL